VNKILKILVFLGVINGLTACSAVLWVAQLPANIAESGLHPAADIDEYDLAEPLNINDAPNIISKHMIVREDGSLWSMDMGYDDQKRNISREAYLGRSSKELYAKVELIDDVKMVVSQSDAIVVLKNDGTVWSWGASNGYWYSSNFGVLGYKKSNTETPLQVIGLPTIKKIFASDGTMLAIDNSGSVWRWGRLRPMRNQEDETLIFNAVAYDVSPEEFLTLDTDLPIKVNALKSIVKVVSYGNTYLTDSGEVYISVLPRFESAMAPYLGEKIGEFIYKVKLPHKAVDIVNETVLLENGQVWRVVHLAPGRLRLKYQPINEAVKPTEKIEGLYGAVKIGYRTTLTENGDVYRWDNIYSFGSRRTEAVATLKSKVPLYVFNFKQEIKSFSRDLVILKNGDIYIYGARPSFNPEFKNPPFTEGLKGGWGNYIYSPSDRIKSVKHNIKFKKLNGVKR
jgi:hypothetical protein